MRLVFEGTVFDPNLRYHLELDGNTRGLGVTGGGGVPGGNGLDNSGGIPGVPDGSGVATVDDAVRLFSAYVAYDFHPCGSEKGCGPKTARTASTATRRPRRPSSASSSR